MNHLSNEQLTEFVEDPGKVADDSLSLHLAVCRECRHRLQQLQRVEQLLPFAVTDTENESPGKYDSNDSIKYLLQKHLFDAHQQGNMHEPEITLNTTPGIFIWNTVKQWFSYRPLSVWQIIPLTAICVYLGYMVTLSLQNPVTQDFIASYQDHAVIRFSPPQDKQPGAGFFYQSAAIEKPFGRMTASIESNLVKLSWPEIEGADYYDIHIYSAATNKLVVRKDRIEKNVMFIEKKYFAKGINYQWEVHAITTGQLHARARAGFVIN